MIDMQSEFCLKNAVSKCIMQTADIFTDYFLHPDLSPDATAGRSIVNTTVRMVESARKSNMTTLWVNVGNFETATIILETDIWQVGNR